MEKRNSKAAVICITFVIIALAAGIFIGWTMGRNDKKSEAQTQTQSESVSDSTPATESESETQTESETHTEASVPENENTEVVVTVGDRKVDMKEVSYRLYSLRNYYIQAYGEEPWNEVMEDGRTVAEAAKAQLDDDIVRTEILVDKASEYGVEATDDIKKACASDAKELIDGLGEDICNEFGLTLEGVESVYLKREISTQVMTAINDKVREELLADSANKDLSEADLEIKISEGYEKKYQEMKKSYRIAYADMWDNIVVGSVG